MSAAVITPRVSSAAQARVNPLWKRQLMIVSRWLHIYLSMASFGILFFFAVTGLTLNHAEWFAKQQHTLQISGTIDRKFFAKDVAKLEVVEQLRNTHGIHGAVKDFRVEDTDCSVAFKGPGYSADVLIDRATGRYELTETSMGFFAILNDLHKGRDPGSAWASGLMAMAAGAVLCYLVYAAWVP